MSKEYETWGSMLKGESQSTRTPEEVIKALETCVSKQSCDCKGCPYGDGCDPRLGCSETMLRDAAACLKNLLQFIESHEIKQGARKAPEGKPPKHDPVNHPDHYTQGGVECIEAIKAACTGLDGFEGYLTGNLIKYAWRWKHKNGVEDLRKAGWYLGALLGAKEAADASVR